MLRRSAQFITVHNIQLTAKGIVAANILPQRGIALNIIDGVIDFRTKPHNPCLTTMKIFRKDDPVFIGHFPDHPVCPGHWLLEVACLTAALFHFCLMPEKSNGKKPLLFHTKDVSWRKQVLPNDIIFSTAFDHLSSSRTFSCSVIIKNVHDEVVMKSERIDGLLA